MSQTIKNIEKKYWKNSNLTKEEWNNYKFFKRSIFFLKYRLPNCFLEKINPDNISDKFVKNYCEIIVNTQENKKIFKINFSLGIVRLILNVSLLILVICLLSFENQLSIVEIFAPIALLSSLNIVFWDINSGYRTLPYYVKFNNYRLHVEYYRCKFAIINNKTNKINNVEHIRKYFKSIMYKFVNEEQINFLKDLKNYNKSYSKFYVLFVTYWFIFVDLIFVIGSFLILLLTALHVFNQI